MALALALCSSLSMHSMHSALPTRQPPFTVRSLQLVEVRPYAEEEEEEDSPICKRPQVQRFQSHLIWELPLAIDRYQPSKSSLNSLQELLVFLVLWGACSSAILILTCLHTRLNLHLKILPYYRYGGYTFCTPGQLPSCIIVEIINEDTISENKKNIKENNILPQC